MDQYDIALLESDSWFARLSASRRHQLLQHAGILSLERGGYVYRLGDEPNGLFALLEGEVRMATFSASGLEMIAMVLRPGLWFGELSVIDGNPRPHDAIATTPARLVRLSMPAIANLTAVEPGLWRDFAILGCTHQRLMMRHSQRLRTQAAIVRLAGFLLGKAALSPNALIPMTQEALADVVGVSRQRINALLKDLSKLGFTRLAYGAVEVSDIAGLRAFIDRHQ